MTIIKKIGLLRCIIYFISPFYYGFQLERQITRARVFDLFFLSIVSFLPLQIYYQRYIDKVSRYSSVRANKENYYERGKAIIK